MKQREKYIKLSDSKKMNVEFCLLACLKIQGEVQDL